MKHALLIVAAILSLSSAQAQDKAPGLPAVDNLQDFYRSGIGLRVGWPVVAKTFKRFVQKRTAVELIATPRYGGASLDALVEFHRASRRDGVYWYYGVGVGAGIFDGADYEDYDGDPYADNVLSVSINGIIGVEKNIHETPFSIAVDFKPRFGVYQAGGSIIEGAISLKYIWSW